MIKRDPSDEPPPQTYRPPSTGSGHDVNHPPPHHEAAGRPYLPTPYDPTRQQPPYQPQPSPYPPQQSPMSATEPYNNPYGTGLPPPREANPYPSVSYPAPRQQPDVRKKAQRAAQACDSCRTLKAKCDEGRPSCTSCKEKDIPCRYRDPPPKQQDKTSQDVIDGQNRLENGINQILARLSELEKQMSLMKQSQMNVSSSAPAMKQEGEDSVRIQVGGYGGPSVCSESQHLPSTESPYSSTSGLQKAPDVVPEPIRPVEEASEEEEEPTNPGPPKAPSIPVNHTTGAARLLLVGPIAEMVKPVLKSGKIKGEKYPIVQEERRGLLRLFGRGEGYDAPPGYDRDPLTDHADSTPGDTPSNVSSPAAGEEWGQLGGLTPPANPGNPITEITGREIGAEGMPDFSRATVWELVKSYNDNINIMHPIMVPADLNALVEQFLKSIPESQAKPRQLMSVVAGHAVPGGSNYKNPESPGNKRKRSPASGDYPDVNPITMDHKPGHPYRSISSALVLLVMALGKISQRKGRIEYLEKERDPPLGSSPTIQNGHLSSPLQSSPSLSTPIGIASPQDGIKAYPRSRRTSLEGGYGLRSNSAYKIKNLDVIPGLAYFALATDVLGNQLAGNSLQHVHANILAGLYHGQLGRVMESHGYIAAACRSLQVILRPKLERFKRLKSTASFVPGKDNPLLFAFWTCLQLESDIVAELPCPHSGILTYEEDMPGPNLQHAVDVDGFDHMIIQSYTAQLFLRKHLNQLHNMFYKPEGEDNQFPEVVVKQPKDHFPTIKACQINLDQIAFYAPNMAWETDKGEPAKDILGARLRAKYYGAQVITYRNLVLKIIELESSSKGEQISHDFKSNIDAPALDKNITRLEQIGPETLEFVRNGIRALVYSTKAFHGLGDPGTTRLIVTNVWGTAHAQWGNMLTLSAAYMNPILSSLLLEVVNKEELQDLLHKTLDFLSLNSTPTSALAIDHKILKYVGQRAGLLPLDGPPTSSSFSSSNTGDFPMGGQYLQ